jgi:2-methylisocitrate lyase-like PEP mutase family enzyme
VRTYVSCTPAFRRPAGLACYQGRVALTQHERAERFRDLHHGETFVIPNPWDAGSAKVLAGLGFEALATTSGGLAFALGQPDGTVTLDEVAAHVSAVSAATDLPVSVDLEHGYGPTPEDAAGAITRAAESGAVGGSIEDFDRDSGELYDLERAVERIAAASEAARALDFQFTLTGRAENFLRGNPDLDDTIARLNAYAEAGADVVYAPFLRTVDQIKAVCEGVSKPVNVLTFAALGLSVGEIAEAGGQRISVGSGLTWVATNALAEAAEKMLAGDLSGLARPDARISDWLGG